MGGRRVTDSKMFQRLRDGDTALGTILLTPSAEWIEILGNLGLDFIIIDMMVTATDWQQAANLVRAANYFGMTPWIRLQSYPWAGAKEQIDMRLPADVLRALSVGAEAVLMSLNTPEEVAAAIHPADDWHRRVYLDWGVETPESLIDRQREVAATTMIMPFIESLPAAQNIEDICAIEGLKSIFLGMGDLSRQMGHAGELMHQDMRDLVQEIVKKASAAGVSVMTNTGRLEHPEDILEMTGWFSDIGIRTIWIPDVEFLLQRLYRPIIQQVRERVSVRR